MSTFSGTYDTLAPRFDDWSAAVVPPQRERWAAKLEALVPAGARVVELGCGTGRPVAARLAGRYDYTGIDASAGMLERALAAAPAGTYVHADMTTVQFDPGSLGGVVSFYAIPHVRREQHASLFRSIASWLRPGGVFVASLHSRDDPYWLEDDWLESGPMQWSGFDRATNLRLLEDTGLETVEAEVIEQTEPDGSTITPLWLVAVRR